jgi:hypothetical protein
MKLPQFLLPSAAAVPWYVLAAALLALASCNNETPSPVDDDPGPNRPPETSVFIAERSRAAGVPVRFGWNGEDADGRVEGFEIALDDTSGAAAWRWTASGDSMVELSLGDDGSAHDHVFFVRAVDDDDAEDPSPAWIDYVASTVSPTIELVSALADCPTLGAKALVSGDTVEVFSDVTFAWTGWDADGEVAGWRSWVDDEPVVTHGPEDTTRTIPGLLSGLHVFHAVAVDEFGVSSESLVFQVHSNFAPVTVIDRSSVVARLSRPWRGDVLVVDDIESNHPDSLDVVPLGSTVSMCWASTDVDGPVVDYAYFFTPQIQGRTGGATCASPSNVLGVSSTLGSRGGVFLVRGIDIHGGREEPPDTLRLFVNFRPRVWWVTPDTAVATGDLVRFEFDGDDEDSDPSLLEFNWNIDNRLPNVNRVPVPPGQRFAEYFFEETDLGVRTVVVSSFDESGAHAPSKPDTLRVHVAPPPPPVRYGWTVSSSPADPFANSGVPVGGGIPLYLWFLCDVRGGGIERAQFGLSTAGALTVTDFVPLNGFVNRGDVLDLDLEGTPCVPSSTVAGIIVVNDQGGSICLTESSATGVDASRGCGVSEFEANSSVGYSSLGPPPCADDFRGCFGAQSSSPRAP